MSDFDALHIFARKPVSTAMVEILAATTSSVIQVKPTKKTYNAVGNLLVAPTQENVTLQKFIGRLISYSNVQTPTLMTSLVYLNRLRNILPGNAVGMETTRHRIFLASLILSAKTLNDSSPLNKHWTKYTDGLLTNQEVNSAERELISLLKWDLRVSEAELVVVLQPFLAEIKNELRAKQLAENNAKSEYYRLSTAYSNSTNSLASYDSYRSGMSSAPSALSLRKSANSQYSLAESLNRIPLREKSSMSLNSRGLTPAEGKHSFGQTLTVPKTQYSRHV
ncbi:hypothetical protein JCM33374_g5944 [Metschnikowia sp. JCM 33374]|nr:hypothetical protein JCM33374_g5944 [Metschnikowia sp. JCM 33374]